MTAFTVDDRFLMDDRSARVFGAVPPPPHAAKAAADSAAQADPAVTQPETDAAPFDIDEATPALRLLVAHVAEEERQEAAQRHSLLARAVLIVLLVGVALLLLGLVQIVRATTGLPGLP